MRLALIVPSFPKLSETFIVNKFIGLLEKGWDVYVVCGVSESGQWQHFSRLQDFPGARKRVVKGWPHRPRWLASLLLPWALLFCFLKNPAGSWRYLRRGFRHFGLRVLRRFYLDAGVLEVAPDLVHFEFGALAVDQTHLKEWLGCKFITSFRGYDLNYAGLETPDYFQKVWERADALHLLGKDLWRHALRRGCPPLKRHVLIAPAIDTEFFSPANRIAANNDGSASRPVRILSVGRLEWKKGYEYAIGAALLLRDMGVHVEYRIVGEGAYFESLAFASHQLGVAREVELLGALPPREVREQMRAADILLHAAVSEGFCNAVLEAQSMGLPVVCSDADGLPENIRDGVTGFVAPRRNAQALAEKLAVLARDPALRQRMGEAGRKRVLEHFQIAGQIEAFERLYRDAQGTTDEDKSHCPL